jgi:hypothetical protein
MSATRPGGGAGRKLGNAPALPWVVLGLMTLFSFGGPLAIFAVVRGGARPDWPPDRPVEWWTLGLVIGAVVVLMAACLTVGIWARPGRKA